MTNNTGPENTEDGPFDAVAAAKELAEALGGDISGATGATDQATQTKGEDYITILEGEIDALNGIISVHEKEKKELSIAVEASKIEVSKAQARISADAKIHLQQKTNSVCKDFLSVLDDVDRAIAAAQGNPDSQDVVQGVELIRKSFLRALEKHGVTLIDAVDSRFDPNLHEAIGTAPISQTHSQGAIVSVVESGYLRDGELLRPARVIVAK